MMLIEIPSGAGFEGGGIAESNDDDVSGADSGAVGATVVAGDAAVVGVSTIGGRSGEVVVGTPPVVFGASVTCGGFVVVVGAAVVVGTVEVGAAVVVVVGTIPANSYAPESQPVEARKYPR